MQTLIAVSGGGRRSEECPVLFMQWLAQDTMSDLYERLWMEETYYRLNDFLLNVAIYICN